MIAMILKVFLLSTVTPRFFRMWKSRNQVRQKKGIRKIACETQILMPLTRLRVLLIQVYKSCRISASPAQIIFPVSEMWFVLPACHIMSCCLENYFWYSLAFITLQINIRIYYNISKTNIKFIGCSLKRKPSISCFENSN